MFNESKNQKHVLPNNEHLRDAVLGFRGVSIGYLLNAQQQGSLPYSVERAEKIRNNAYFYFFPPTPAGRKLAEGHAMVHAVQERIEKEMPQLLSTLNEEDIWQLRIPESIEGTDQSRLRAIYRETEGVLLVLNTTAKQDPKITIETDAQLADVGGRRLVNDRLQPFRPSILKGFIPLGKYEQLRAQEITFLNKL